MHVVNVRMPKWMIDIIDHMVETGKYMSRSDLIRCAVRYFLFNKEKIKIMPEEKRIPTELISKIINRHGIQTHTMIHDG